MTLKSKDSVKVLTVRGTNFAPAAEEGGNAKTEAAPTGDFASKVSTFVSQELTKSDRPELTAAKVIISGGTLGFAIQKGVRHAQDPNKSIADEPLFFSGVIN